MVLGQQLSASLQRQRGPLFLSEMPTISAFWANTCPAFCIPDLVWAEVRFNQGGQGGFDVRGLPTEHHHCTDQNQLQYWQDTSQDWQPLSSERTLEGLSLSSAIPCFAPATATPQTSPPHTTTAHAGVLHQLVRSCGQAAGCLRFTAKQRQERSEHPQRFAGDLLGDSQAHGGPWPQGPAGLKYSPRAVMDTGVLMCRSPTICHSPSSVRVHSATRHS